MANTDDEDSGYHFIDGKSYCELPDAGGETWLIKPIVPAGGWVNIFGKPKKARKSYLALGMAWAISTYQEEWLGFEVKGHGPVIYLQADTPRALWKQRVKEIAAGGYDMSNVYFADLYALPKQFNIIDHEAIITEMVSEIDGAVMVVLDTSRKMHTGDENSSQDMAILMNTIESVCGLDKAKILVSHDKKGGAQDVTERDSDTETDLMEGARGSSGVAGGVDTVIKMTPKGYMYYQGRAVGEERKKLKFTHIDGTEMGYMWEEDLAPEIIEARKLLHAYKDGSVRSLGRMLAQKMHWGGDAEEKARSVIRRQKEEGR